MGDKMTYLLRAHDWADVGEYPTLGAAQRAAEHHGPRQMSRLGIAVEMIALDWIEQSDGTWHGIPAVLLRVMARHNIRRETRPLYTITTTTAERGR